MLGGLLLQGCRCGSAADIDRRGVVILFSARADYPLGLIRDSGDSEYQDRGPWLWSSENDKWGARALMFTFACFLRGASFSTEMS